MNISFIGAGRVADILSKTLYSKGYKINSIVSTTEANGRKLAEAVNAEWYISYEFSLIDDLIIVAVSDRSLQKVISEIKCSLNTMVVHTAGSFGLEVFDNTSISRKGVMYPLQTFSKDREIGFGNLPFLIEASNEEGYIVMEEIVKKLGSVSYRIDTESRRLYHLAAVFVCNFTNYMLTSGKRIVDLYYLPFDLLKPLVEETVNKAFDMGPENSQTGPAIRNDINTLNKHRDLLSFDPELKKLYNMITESISEYYNNNN
jgi:predicted short-subunit dehydrogenase-like oxidoreductase (DUF2520 family)